MDRYDELSATTWSRVLLEKAIMAQPVKDFYAFYGI
jgi:hypothetical protein